MLGWKGLEHTSIHKACNIFRFRPRRFFKISLSQFVEPGSKKAKDMFRKLKYFLSQKVKSGVQHQFASTCVLHRNELTSFHRWTECQRDSGRYNKRSYFVQKQGYKKQVLNLPLNFGTYGREMGQVHNPIHNLLKKKNGLYASLIVPCFTWLTCTHIWICYIWYYSYLFVSYGMQYIKLKQIPRSKNKNLY